MKKFKLKSNYKPTGDQPTAIEQLVGGFLSGKSRETLLGVTGSGKTLTILGKIKYLLDNNIKEDEILSQDIKPSVVGGTA